MIHFENIVKTYKGQGGTVCALRNVTLHLEKGGFLAVTGGSGSGKTTLMNMVGCLDRPDSGRRLLDGQDLARMGDRQLSRLRNEKIGFIFQSFNLLRDLTALENVMLPLAIRGTDLRRRREAAAEALARVGLGDRLEHRPGQLSGGQQQRVAIARVIACRTPLILADEPTGNLDKRTGNEIMALFDRLHEEGNTIVLITHDPGVAARAQRVLRMDDGCLTAQTDGGREADA